MTSATSATATDSGRRRSSRSQRLKPQNYIPFQSFRRPWNQHYLDMGHSRIRKCTLRIQNAKNSDIEHLKVSMLGVAIRASVAYTPKGKQERSLLDYAGALTARGIPLNDYDNGQSAVALAAYHGYPKLLVLLLRAGYSAVDGSPNSLESAVSNCQYECTDLLLEHRQEEIRTFLQNDAMVPRVPGIDKCSLLWKLVARMDVRAVRVLRDRGNAMVSTWDLIPGKSALANLELLLRELYSDDANVLSWNKRLHWSFPTADRSVINWIWHHVAQRQSRDGCLPPPEIWLHILSFIGRGWWMGL